MSIKLIARLVSIGNCDFGGNGLHHAYAVLRAHRGIRHAAQHAIKIAITKAAGTWNVHHCLIGGRAQLPC
ncbi:hypothetical protein [Bradyrhizobium forestalis]|uniref:hypothetical protein n=1 Tax=Bradyrhizobium forestalis TaxID=1419263 RepID=UPI0011AFC1FD|nr:hypothetical protein [Bradyrhizobium forestalis]